MPAAPGCFTPRLNQVGNPYCANTGFNRCDTASAAVNHATHTYAAVVILGSSPAAACTHWTLSVSYGTRAPSRNLVAHPGPLYAEADLNTADVPDDSSPFFPGFAAFQPLVFTCDTSYKYLNSLLIDPDNQTAGYSTLDSLAYALEAPWSGPQQPLPYVPGFSAAQPLPTAPGQPVVLDPVTGTLTFQAAAPHVPGPPARGRNKYTLAYRVTTWRRVSGGPRIRSGSTRRETTVVVYHCLPPPLPPVILGPDTTLAPGLPDTLRVWHDRPDTLRLLVDRSTCDSVLVDVNNSQLPSGASLQFTRLQPNAWLVEIRWNPGPAALPGYYPVTVRARCDECPLPIRVDRTFVLHVRRRPGPARPGPHGGGYPRPRHRRAQPLHRRNPPNAAPARAAGNPHRATAL